MGTPILLLAVALGQGPAVWTSGPPLPNAVTNNAVAAVVTPEGPAVFSFLGLDSTKRWDGIVTASFRWNIGEPRWSVIAPVPGRGRLAATAQAWRGRIFLFGGYTVDTDGTEHSVPQVDVYDPAADAWSRAADIPIPVDDAVSGIWRDSLIFLVSGWHDRDNVSHVQIYDPARNEWRLATPIPGAPVFGHAGAVLDNSIVYVDGVRVNQTGPRFTMEPASWLGEIDPADATRITWIRLPDHPGPSLYRAAAGAISGWVLFAGGSDNPYNYNGVGYNSIPAAARTAVLGWDMDGRAWHALPPLPAGSMDHRGLVAVAGWLVIAGGMRDGQTVTRRVWVASIDRFRGAASQ